METHIRLGRIAGIEVGLNWSVLLVFWLIAWSLAGGLLPANVPGLATWAYWLAGLTTAAVFFLCLLAHEMAHALMARREGVRVEGITLWLFGGVARLRGEGASPETELKTTLVGPATSLGLAALFAAAAWAMAAAGAVPLAVYAVGWLGLINLVLALFNMVPAFPLDGGRILRALLWKWKGDQVRATRTAATAGRVFGYVLIVLGLLEFLMAAALGGLWLVFLGWFLLGAARMEESLTLLKGALQDVRVEDIMTRDPVTVPAGASMEVFVEEYAMKHRASAFPVEERDGRITGLLTLTRVKETPREERPHVTVAERACPLEEVGRVRASDPAMKVLEEMHGCADGRALVFEGDRLAGIVTPRDLHRAFELAGLRGVPMPREVMRAASS